MPENNSFCNKKQKKIETLSWFCPDFTSEIGIIVGEHFSSEKDCSEKGCSEKYDAENRSLQKVESEKNTDANTASNSGLNSAAKNSVLDTGRTDEKTRRYSCLKQVFQNGWLRLIDQTLLPAELVEIDCKTVEQVWDAIKRLAVRGAPAIGIAAAYGVCVGLQSFFQNDHRECCQKDCLKNESESNSKNELENCSENFAGKSDFASPISDAEQNRFFFEKLEAVVDYLASSRPTAVNLFWALDRMKAKAKSLEGLLSPEEIAIVLFEEAQKIHEEDRAICRAMGRFGAALVKDGDVLLTHCNAGGLATADFGTALGVFFAAWEQGKRIRVYADETRPLLQGARLTAWELREHGIPITLICDSMAAMVMKQGKINAVFVGADRIAANGDTANKIGTYSVAVNARAHSVPFYVVAPTSTFDLTLVDGSGIPIEERNPEEIRNGFGRQTAPDNIDIYNPAFDVTPADLIAGIITEKGIIAPITVENVRKMVE